MVTLRADGIPCISFTEGDETGVMDSLLEALQSGAAFRDRRKKTPKPKGEHYTCFMLLSRELSQRTTLSFLFFFFLILLKSCVKNVVPWATTLQKFHKFS